MCCHLVAMSITGAGFILRVAKVAALQFHLIASFFSGTGVFCLAGEFAIGFALGCAIGFTACFTVDFDAGFAACWAGNFAAGLEEALATGLLAAFATGLP